jgi:hypothetical protein
VVLASTSANLPLPLPKQTIIQGITLDDKPFRPSDWAERLAGVMSGFREGAVEGTRYLDYSPWCVPINQGNVRCVIVDHAIKDYNVMAWDFVMNFAKDNKLHVAEVCLLPEVKKS